MKTIIGIDPGSRITGYGVIQFDGNDVKCRDFGSLRLNLKKDFSHRIYELGGRLHEVFKAFSPDEVVVEQIFLGKNADSAFKLGHARGVCIYEAMVAGARLFEYSTRSVKKGITGNGGATKEQVQLVLSRTLGIPITTDIDASDALAMAVHHAHYSRVQAKLNQLNQGGFR